MPVMGTSGGAGRSAPAARPLADDGALSHHGDRPCPLPWAPDGCQTMAPCPVVALAAILKLPALPSRVEVSPARLAVRTPPSRTRAPESPPPKLVKA